MKKNSPRFYFNFRSPYSWLAFKIMDEHYSELQAAIEFIPFWEPDDITKELLVEKGADIIVQAMSKEKHLYILYDIKRLVNKLNYSISWPVDLKPWWEPSHLAYFVAKDHNKEKEFIRAVYKARFEKGVDISIKDNVRNICESIGLNPDDALAALDNELYRDRGAQVLYQAYSEQLIGVPYFVHKRDKFWGVDRLKYFIDSIQDADQADTYQQPEFFNTIYDTDCAGGCG